LNGVQNISYLKDVGYGAGNITKDVHTWCKLM
jgi:hypothetical protein